MQILSVGILALVFPAPSHPAATDTGWLTYRVLDLEERGSDSLRLSPQIERVVEFRGRGYPAEWEGQPVYILEKEDRTKDGNKIFWKFILDPDQFWLRRLEKRITGPQGVVIAESWFNYRNSAWGFPRNLCHLYTIQEAIMAMDFQPGTRRDFYLLLTEEASPWHMYLVTEKAETIAVPAGRFHCWRLSLKPDYQEIMGKWSWASPLISPFVPDYYFWVGEAPPHTLIRFEGRFGPKGASPLQAYELLSIQGAQ